MSSRMVFVTPYWEVYAPDKLSRWIYAPHTEGAELNGRKHRKQIKARINRAGAAITALSEAAWELNLDAENVERGLKTIFGE